MPGFGINILAEDGFRLAVHIISFGLVALASGTSCRSIKRRLMPDELERAFWTRLQVYQDKDGVATMESIRAFSDKPQRACYILFTIAGTAGSLTQQAMGLATMEKTLLVEQWLQISTWIMMMLQAGALLMEDQMAMRFKLALRGSMCYLTIIMMLCVEWYYLPTPMTIRDSLRVTFAIQLLSAILALTSGLLLPRRPDVFWNGIVVDRQLTRSFFSRLSFGWVQEVVQYAGKNSFIGLQDLPELDCHSRSASLVAAFHCSAYSPSQRSTPLWKRLAWAHRSVLLLQLFLTVTGSILNFTPQMVLWGLLTTLERHSQPLSIWLWVVGLGVSTLTASTVDSWVYWTSFNTLAVRVYSQLLAVMCDKALRMKDIKDNSPSDDSEPGKKLTSEGQGNFISLVTIDAGRVSTCASSLFILYEAPIKLSIAGILISQLLGWQSLLLGIITLVLLIPANLYFAKRYAAGQVHLLKSRDIRMEALSEVLQGIRQVKFSASERLWEDHINLLRDRELHNQRDAWFWQVLVFAFYVLCPVLVSTVSLAASTLYSAPSASVIFTAISVFGAVESTLATFPQALINFLNTRLSLVRIDRYLRSPETARLSPPSDRIIFDQATISWPTNTLDIVKPFHLRNLNVSFPPSSLSIISGKTGSGKSLLLAATLGECEILSGKVCIPETPSLSCFENIGSGQPWVLDSAVAYVSQNPWIENGTIRENILFGLPFSEERYRQVLSACALNRDLEIFVDGEQTEIGAKGVNLSGGQKWRVALARALYSRAGTLVIDDIFSAVDAHTARHLYENALTGALAQSRTRILVTHHLALCLPRTSYIVYLEQGCMRHADSVEGLRQTGALEFILHQANETEACHVPTDAVQECSTSDISSAETEVPTVAPCQVYAPKQQTRKFLTQEDREHGAVKWKTYVAYFQRIGGVWYLISLGTVYAAYSGCMIGRSWWLSVWSSPPPSGPTFLQKPLQQHILTSESIDADLPLFIGGYLALSLLVCVTGLLRNYLVLFSAMRGSKTLFRELLYAVLRSPLSWLDTTPLGRIMNRFSADFNVIDTELGFIFNNLFSNLCDAVTILVAASLVNPKVLLISAALLPFCIQFGRLFLRALREIKRLQSITKSPIFDQIISVIEGLPTIRAFGAAHLYNEQIQTKIDDHAKSTWHIWLLIRWFTFRMNALSSLFTVLAAGLIVSVPGISAAKVGFAITFMMRYARTVVQVAQQYGNTEMAMNSMERIIEYRHLPSESYEGRDPPAAWPTEGHLTVIDLVVSYAPDLPPALNKVSFEIMPSQRIGIVGRTGAGKSSLALALFRFMEAQQGRVIVDGIDIATIPLEQLRGRLSIIPQDPILFTGTVRSNLDPFQEYSDLELLDALARVHWTPDDREYTLHSNSVVSKPASQSILASVNTSGQALSDSESGTLDSSGSQHTCFPLDTAISTGGSNLSQGQRQLLCLARAILTKSKILVLDEATSAVDKTTDALIQQSIREESSLNSTTLLVIAHRISTVADFDRILVLDEGKVVEDGSPQELACIRGGRFRALLEESMGEEGLSSVFAEGRDYSGRV